MRRNRRNSRNSNNYINDDTKKIIKVLLKFICILLILFFIVMLFNILNNWITYHSIINQSQTSSSNVDTNISEQNDVSENTNENTTFNLTAIGDIMCNSVQSADAYISDSGEYDFSYVFEDIEYYIKNSSITVANLETTFAGKDKGYNNPSRFNSPDALAYNLKKLGVDVISTAGNHSLDYGFDGLSRTIDVLNLADISHVGTYKTQEERDTILFKYVKGVKIAFLNYTYRSNENKIPSDKAFCINIIDKDIIKNDIEKAKSENAEIIIASIHWGTEYDSVPNNTQDELADFLFQNGVNVILGTHPHILQKMEKRTVTLEDGSTQDGFIIYSLGNFISDLSSNNAKSSIILELQITKHTDNTIMIDNVNYIPIYMYKDSSVKTKKIKLLDIQKTLSLYDQGIDTSIGKNMYTTLKTTFNTISKTLNP